MDRLVLLRKKYTTSIGSIGGEGSIAQIVYVKILKARCACVVSCRVRVPRGLRSIVDRKKPSLLYSSLSLSLSLSPRSIRDGEMFVLVARGFGDCPS